MPYSLFYHPEITKVISKIPKTIKLRIQNAIKNRLTRDPIKYGEPLKRSLQGYRKLRVGDYRVIYQVTNDDIKILKIGHRKEIYQRPLNRLLY